MKTNFLKTVLPASALALAITASLAFNSTKPSDEELPVVYLDIRNQCLEVPADVGCAEVGTVICTAFTNDGPKGFYKDPNCTIVLYKAE